MYQRCFCREDCYSLLPVQFPSPPLPLISRSPVFKQEVEGDPWVVLQSECGPLKFISWSHNIQGNGVRRRGIWG